MISGIVISQTGSAPRSLSVAFNTNLAPGILDLNAVGVNFGATAAYGQSTTGQATAVNADGTIACIVAVTTDIAPVHIQCEVSDYNGNFDRSTDQVFGAGSTGGGDDDGEHGRGDHGRGHGRGHDGHGDGGGEHEDRGRGRGVGGGRDNH